MSRGLSSCGTWALERRLSSCGAWALLLRGMWDLPRPGLEPVSHALAGGFLTTAPAGKSGLTVFKWMITVKCVVCVGVMIDSFPRYRSSVKQEVISAGAREASQKFVAPSASLGLRSIGCFPLAHLPFPVLRLGLHGAAVSITLLPSGRHTLLGKPNGPLCACTWAAEPGGRRPADRRLGTCIHSAPRPSLHPTTRVSPTLLHQL